MKASSSSSPPRTRPDRRHHEPGHRPNNNAARRRQAKDALEPDAKQMLAFIKLLHGASALPVWFQTYSSDADLKQYSSSFGSPLNSKLKARLLKANAAQLNVSMAVNEVNGPTRKSSNVSRINAVFVDAMVKA